MKDEVKDKVLKFLQHWKDSDYKKMYAMLTLTWASNHKVSDLKNVIVNRIKSYEIVSINMVSSSMCDVTAKVTFKGKVKTIVIRCIKEIEPYKPSIEGTWGVNPVSAIRNLN